MVYRAERRRRARPVAGGLHPGLPVGGALRRPLEVLDLVLPHRRHLCLDQRRKHRGWKLWVRDEGDPESHEPLLDRQPAPSQDPVDTIGRERTLKRLWEAVGRLAPQQRAAVILQVQEELPTPEIAAGLKCSEATVRGHLPPALTKLRETMGTARHGDTARPRARAVPAPP